MRTIDEVIQQCKNEALAYAKQAKSDGDIRCLDAATDYKQIAEWLEELKTLRKKDFDCANCDAKATQYSTGFKDGFLAGKDSVRQTGEWVYRKEWFEDEPSARMAWGCPICGHSVKSEHDRISFCPKCGSVLNMPKKMPEIPKPAITITGITPPECCADCRFFDDSGDYPSCIALNIARGYNFDYCHKVMEDCPITKEKSNATNDIQ